MGIERVHYESRLRSQTMQRANCLLRGHLQIGALFMMNLRSNFGVVFLIR